MLVWQSRQLWQPVKAVSHLQFCQCRWNWANANIHALAQSLGSHPFPHSQRNSQDPHVPPQTFPTCVWNKICFSQFKEQPPTGCPCPHSAQPRVLLSTMHRDKRRALTAIVFSLIPPTGRIFPVNDTSPVMATFCLTGQFMARDSRAVTMVHPALGPSFGVAPCLKKQSTTPLLIQEAA